MSGTAPIPTCSVAPSGQREIRKTHVSVGLFTADTADPLWKSAHDAGTCSGA